MIHFEFPIESFQSLLRKYIRLQQLGKSDIICKLTFSQKPHHFEKELEFGCSPDVEVIYSTHWFSSKQTISPANRQIYDCNGTTKFCTLDLNSIKSASLVAATVRKILCIKKGTIFSSVYHLFSSIL